MWRFKSYSFRDLETPGWQSLYDASAIETTPEVSNRPYKMSCIIESTLVKLIRPPSCWPAKTAMIAVSRAISAVTPK